MSIDFSKLESLAIGGVELTELYIGGVLAWAAPSKKRWDLLNRTEFRGERADATYYFNADNANHRMYLSEDVWVNGGRHILDGVYNASHTGSGNFCTLSNITENSFTLTTGAGGGTERFAAFPFHLNAGETITVTHTRSAHNRSGYQIFNTDGTLRSYVRKNLSNSPGAVDTITFTAPDECWFFWIHGRQDAGTSVTISEISVIIAQEEE